MKSRSKKPNNQSKKDDSETATSRHKPLHLSDEIPPQVLVLPEDVSARARIVTIPNPATSAPNRYLICPEKGFYEFTRIAAPKRQHRSWLLALGRRICSNAQTDAGDLSHEELLKDDLRSDSPNAGYVLQKSDLFVATPIDPLFLLLPVLAISTASAGQEYLASSDHLTRLAQSSQHLAQVINLARPEHLEHCLEARIDAVCDCMDMCGEKLYALSLPKLVKELVGKARKMTAKGLPKSMEERFVKQALDIPVLSIRREESNISVIADKVSVDSDSQLVSESNSQTSDACTTTTASQASSATSISTSSSNDITSLLRLRTALQFLLNTYVAASLRPEIEKLLADSQHSLVDWTPLDTHIAFVTKLKNEAHALRSLSDNVSRKRSAEEDDEALERMEAKKRKKEEDELKKKNVSHGVKRLQKADTSGMKKLSSFFTKK